MLKTNMLDFRYSTGLNLYGFGTKRVYQLEPKTEFKPSFFMSLNFRIIEELDTRLQP